MSRGRISSKSDRQHRIQSSFPCLKDTSVYEDTGERRILMKMVCLLYNLRARTVGRINQIKNVFMRHLDVNANNEMNMMWRVFKIYYSSSMFKKVMEALSSKYYMLSSSTPYKHTYSLLQLFCCSVVPLSVLWCWLDSPMSILCCWWLDPPEFCIIVISMTFIICWCAQRQKKGLQPPTQNKIYIYLGLGPI